MELRNDFTIQTLTELRQFAEKFLDETDRGKAFGLSGELGAGKTTFVRTVIELICNRAQVPVPRVTSPTYVIQARYPQLIPCIEHFDLYRLESVDRKVLTEIGYYESLEYVSEKNGILFVEWPEKASLPENLGLSQILKFSVTDSGRLIRFGP